MSTDTATDANSLDDRTALDRLRSSQFLSDLLSNRLAVIGLTIIVGMILVAVYARVAYDLNALTQSQLGTVPDRLRPGWTGAGPVDQHIFGTDASGRDIYKRTLYGAWIAMKYGTVTVAASTLIGVALGIIAAYYSDLTDNVIMRTMDVLLSFPSLLLALALVAIFGSGLWKVVIALTLVYTPRFARVVRGAALKVLEDEYIEATEALGANDLRVLAKHVFPNTLAPVTVQSTLNYGLAIIDFAALSFLGFGAGPGMPSWGLMLDNGVSNGLLTGKWWMSVFPGLFLAILVLGFNLLGDGMRDALDPRMRETVD
ncbi:ABC transporter permease [Halobacterium jilantaiense]|uniref:Peptide/nickel transport system permease protein n=1 Tax=Halobacterium jilantaiense TaxID=355548 RepID=A0A1I0PGX0_9EURY|nr:ABC transporter permease [Halobacterium jilantaiense]SEW13626.1 peptide/nickel transport system permease protein [Halobacterium jilantaiense]